MHWGYPTSVICSAQRKKNAFKLKRCFICHSQIKVLKITYNTGWATQPVLHVILE